MGHPIHKHMSSGQRYDDKQAYNKKLSSKARLHYLENEEHDKGMSRYEEGMSRQASPLNAAKSAGRSGHPRHMQSGVDNSGNPNAASSDEYWRKHQQSRHHRSAPKETEEAPSRKSSPANNLNKGYKSQMGKPSVASMNVDPAEAVMAGAKDTREGAGGMSRQVSPLNNEGHGGKKGHGHIMIKKKKGKLKPIVNKDPKERLPERVSKKQ